MVQNLTNTWRDAIFLEEQSHIKLRPSVKEDKLAGKNLIEGDKEDTWYLILALGEREGEVEMVPKNVYFQVWTHVGYSQDVPDFHGKEESRA